MSDAFNDNEDQSKLDKIKLFAHVLVRYMSDDNYLGIVVFGTKARTMLPLCRMSPETRVSSLQTVGGSSPGRNHSYRAMGYRSTATSPPPYCGLQLPPKFFCKCISIIKQRNTVHNFRATYA